MTDKRMTLPSGPRGERSRHTFEAVRELIVGGVLDPGERIIETELAERLGVSRGALRPALQQLHQEGLVVGNVPGRQTRLIVAPVTRADAHELYYLAGDLEGLAAFWTAERDETVRASVADRMAGTNDEIRELHETGRLRGERLLELDREFHEAYIEVGGGPRTRALLDSLRPQLDRYARLYTRSFRDRVARSIVEHDHIVSAMREGDPERTRAAVQENWREGAAQLMDVIEVRGEIGPEITA